MDLVKTVMAVGLAAWLAGPVHGCDVERWQPYIAEAARSYGIAEAWIRAVMRAESAGCTHLDGRPIASSAGAMGLMQLMPGTWAELQERYGLGADPHDPRENILAGTAYLRELADRFGVPGAFAAYHAGPGRYEKYRMGQALLPRETREYLAQVVPAAGLDYPGDVPRSAGDALFAVDRVRRTEDAGSPWKTSSSRLFVALRHERNPQTSRPSDPGE